MKDGVGLDNEWIWDALKYCGDIPLEMPNESGCKEGIIHLGKVFLPPTTFFATNKRVF